MTPRFGIFLSAQHPPAMAPAQIARDCCEQVRLARELGFADVSAGQHFLTQPYQMLQLVPLLARVAAEAGEMRVCSGILLLTLLNPVEVAENAATLDAITDGRFVLGLGLGYRQEENDAFGLPEKRLRIFEQKVDVVRRLLDGEAVTAEGHGFRLREQRLAIRPTQSPRPPIWLAANNDNAVLRAARLADAWLLNPHTKLAELERQLALYRAERERCGLAAAREIPIVKELHVGSDDESAMRAIQPYLEDKYRAYVQWGQSEVMPAGDTLRQAFEGLAEGGRFIVGGPETCARQIREHVERLGVTSFLFRFQWPGMPQDLVLASMRRLAEEVVPLLRAA
jgi:alkanesulfonate monooxygenase SsuD/methylene tetrahydromethanopterin reductase-like flavin-dependent oxidoreductase (luciferase family)